MIDFNNTYEKLPEHFFSKESAEKIEHPELILFNDELAKSLNLDGLLKQENKELAKFFSGQASPFSGSHISFAYAGHQFGHFVPQLGDGRALLLGEVLNQDGKRFDIQLKGSGRTRFSRRGDGKSSLGPVIREYIVSEALHYLGIPTTRALAAVSTNETVYREEAFPGGILTRVASSHLRIGTFQFFAAQNDDQSVKTLLNYSIERHYPHLKNIKDDVEKITSFIEEVGKKQALMVAKWMSIGFIHGVMNTDNMSICGETLDFGPCALMDKFSFDKVFSYIDQQGRYRYENQVPIAQWNLTRLAECFFSLLPGNEKEKVQILEQTLEKTSKFYKNFWREQMGFKFGFTETGDEEEKIINNYLEYLQLNQKDFTESFFNLKDSLDNNLSHSQTEFENQWKNQLKKRNVDFVEAKNLMTKANPYLIPRNHIVESCIQSSYEKDFKPFIEYVQALKTPYLKSENNFKYFHGPNKQEEVHTTFCGT